MNRRHVLQVMGAAAVVAACAPGDDPAAAWRAPGAGEQDPRRRALAWGILAPNPHNMQPWMVDLATPGEAVLHLHPDRLLPQTDPFGRQIVIGCGAFCELTRMAAAREGWAVEIEPLPAPADALPGAGPLVRLRFTPAPPVVDPLFAAAGARRTNRSPFDARPVPQALADAVAFAAARPGVAAQATVDPARVAALRAIAFEGARVEAFTPAANGEGMDRTFIGARQIAAHRYGISITGPVPELAQAAGLLSRESMLTPGAFGFEQTLQFLKAGAESARGFVWLVTPQNDRAAQLEAGRAYLRANLRATALGLAMQPWSQCLQEYATMAPSLAAVHRALAPQGGRVQMFARLGYGPPVPPAPKRGLDAQILRT